MSERTHITDMDPVDTAPPSAERVPCLVIREGLGGGTERVVALDIRGRVPTLIGQSEECQVILDDSAVSRRHAMVRLEGEGAEVIDLGSTNGSFVAGRRFEGATRIVMGQTFQVGRHLVTLDLRDPRRAHAAQELARDLERASHYVISLLPQRVESGPVRLDWAFEPSAKLGGDVFGYHAIDDWTIAGYLIDVSGHGVGAAMHSTSILSTLRRQALPDTDFRDPGAVLTRLNDTFLMDDYDGFCFTIWYGVFDRRTRVLRYGSGGHHPAYLVSPLGGAPLPLRVRNPVMGALPGQVYASAEVLVLPGGRLHVFSDGCFEIATRDGDQWGLPHFLPLLTETEHGPGIAARRIFEAVRAVARPGPLADDFSIMSVTFS